MAWYSLITFIFELQNKQIAQAQLMFYDFVYGHVFILYCLGMLDWLLEIKKALWKYLGYTLLIFHEIQDNFSNQLLLKRPTSTNTWQYFCNSITDLLYYQLQVAFIWLVFYRYFYTFLQVLLQWFRNSKNYVWPRK